MAGPESRTKLAEWRVIQHRGRNKILRASRDPVARAKLRAEIPSPMSGQLRISEADRASAIATFPAFLSEPLPTPSTSRHSFLTFPPEIRNAIYRYSVQYPTCRSLYDYYYDQKEKAKAKIELRPRSANTRVSRHSKVPLRTPTILLLCKQITREALSFLYCQVFVIDRIPPWLMGNSAPLPLTDFVSRPTLQSLRFVEIKISLGESANVGSGNIWLGLLNGVLDAWSERNALVRLHIVFKLSNVTRPNMWFYELEDFEKLVEKLSYFEFKHGSRPGLIRWEHWVLDFEYAYKVGYRNPIIRIHPDPYIWQGSVIEWV
ncbi:hypothetical protein F4820DRAFT_383895 [Hypoxylon rubiginosum]|uniref:Uncharacterized protein n=1 Tax=Hypoxylon rubiginosum TaxID=110542 RepID=A0ACB9ZDC8_9PEZI|nr:hypothetical protein F4820DRAFT_383895 [Hypoxylon rubiginosum]